MMMKPRNPRAVSPLILTVCLGFLVLALFSCKNPTGTDQDTQPYINVRNGSGIDLDIYLDGTFQFYLLDNEYYLIENVAAGTHLLEAKRKDTNILVKSLTVETTEEFGYTWTITSDASLRVTNNYGETLDIYGDGEYQSDIADQSEIIAAHFPYGEHLIEAKKTGGTTVVASITIEVLEDIQYTWVIQK